MCAEREVVHGAGVAVEANLGPAREEHLSISIVLAEKPLTVTLFHDGVLIDPITIVAFFNDDRAIRPHRDWLTVAIGGAEQCARVRAVRFVLMEWFHDVVKEDPHLVEVQRVGGVEVSEGCGAVPCCINGLDALEEFLGACFVIVATTRLGQGCQQKEDQESR